MDVAKNIIIGTADFLKAILAQIAQLIEEISIHLALVLILTGSTLYFSHLKRRLGRDFVTLSIILALVKQIFK